MQTSREIHSCRSFSETVYYVFILLICFHVALFNLGVRGGLESQIVIVSYAEGREIEYWPSEINDSQNWYLLLPSVALGIIRIE